MRLDENILRIKEVMGLITEVDVNPQSVEINLGNLFGPGKYVITAEIAKKITTATSQIKSFMAKNPEKPVTVTVESSESKVPNYDRETYPSTGDKKVDFTSEKKLSVGELSKKRADSLSVYLKPRLPKNAQIVVNDKGAQGPVWDGVNVDADKYTQQQYVKLFAKLNTAQPKTNLYPEIKRETVQTGTYFCDGKNSGNIESEETTYVRQCAKLPNNIKLSKIATTQVGNNNKSRYMSAFEIKYGVNVTGDSYVVPRARFNFYWDSTGKKITSVTKQTYSQPTATEGPKILTEKPISSTDAELKYLMGIKEGDPNGGTSYRMYIAPYV
jgi:hypothetical protein